MFKIKFSENMAKQLEEPKEEFPTRDAAERYGLGRYGSGTFNSKYGWSVVEV